MTNKLCPFCGSEPEKSNNTDWVFCKNKECPISIYNAYDCSYDAQGWNTRPIEDKLTARIAELKAEVKELKKFDWTDGSVPPEYVGWYLAHPKEVGGIRQFYYAGNPAEYEEFKDTIKEWQFQY